jgi:hypothetical protein
MFKSNRRKINQLKVITEIAIENIEEVALRKVARATFAERKQNTISTIYCKNSSYSRLIFEINGGGGYK